MIYSLIKYLLKVTIYSYFRRVTILGKEHIPARGPVIFVANHPSALMDPLVVITGIKRRINPIAAAEFFGGEFIFPNKLSGMHQNSVESRIHF